MSCGQGSTPCVSPHSKSMYQMGMQTRLGPGERKCTLPHVVLHTSDRSSPPIIGRDNLQKQKRGEGSEGRRRRRTDRVRVEVAHSD